MRDKYLLATLLSFSVLTGLVVVAEVGFGDKGKSVLQRGVSSSVLRYGTLGEIMSELGLLSGYRPKGFQPVDESVLVNGEAMLSFTLESDIPVGGSFYSFLKNEDGSPGEFELEPILNRTAGKTQYAFKTFSFDDLFGIRIDIDTLNANLKISDVKLVDHRLRKIPFNSKKTYSRFVPNNKVVVHNIDDSGIEFSTLSSGDGDGYVLFNMEGVKPVFDGFASMFGNKRENTGIALNTNKLSEGPADLSADLLSQNSDLPIISINAPDGEFDDEYGIVTNLDKRGREYERLIDVTYYDVDGNRIFSSPVGIRYHGGYHRAKYDSYKIYFRSVYGSTENQQSLIFPGHPMPIKSLVLHHTQFPEYSPIGHLLAIDLFEAIGVDTPRRKPVLVYLNNEELGFYYLTDHLSMRNFEAYFGTDNFRFYRFKSYNTPQDTHALNKDMWLINNFKKGRDEFPVEHIYETFDVEGITNFMIANTVFNTQDYCQGVLYRRDDLDDKKWRMIGWDFDGAFMKVEEWTVPRVEDTFNIVQEAYTVARGCPYQIIFRKLLANSPEYRQYFKEQFHTALETVFSPDETKRILAEYRTKYEGKFGITSESFDMLEDYFERRPAFIKQQTDEHLAYWDNLAD